MRQIEGMGIDLYYLGADLPNATFELGAADDPRHSLGVRLFGKAGAFDYDNEAVYQFGKLGPLDIGAWRLATDLGYSFEAAPLKPRMGLGVDVSTGDKERGDDRFDMFIPLFPKGNPFGASPLIGPINLITIEPNVLLHFTETVSLRTAWSFYWRYSKNDGVYSDGLRLIQPPDGSDERYAGSELTFDLGWQINRNLVLVAQYSHFFTGAFLNETGPGKDVNYVSVQAQFRF